MNQFNKKKTALAVALFLSGWHIIWSLIVAVGLGQVIYDFVLWAHMIHLPIIIGPFNLTASLVLIIFTFVVGYIFGFIFAHLWNRLHREA